MTLRDFDKRVVVPKPEVPTVRQGDAPHEGSSAQRPQSKVIGMRFSPEVNLGALLQAVVVTSGIIIWAVTSNNRGEQTQRDLGELKSELAQQIKELRQSLNVSVSELRTDVRAVPTRLDSMDKWISAHESRTSADEQRITDLERQIGEMRATLTGLANEINGPLLPRGKR